MNNSNSKWLCFIICTLSVCKSVDSSKSSLIIKDFAEENCVTNQKKFWEICNLHFILTKTITITLLHEGDRTFLFKQFLDKYLDYLYTYHSTSSLMAIKIRELVLLEYTKNQNRLRMNIHQSVGSTPKFSDKISVKQLMGIKKLYTNSAEGHVIVVWSIEVLQRFLDENYKIVIPKARSTYLVLVVNSHQDNCELLRKQIGEILSRLWLQFTVFDVISQTPCSCHSEVVYIHRPVFRVAQNSWGAVFNYTIDEILDHPKLITNSIKDFNEYPLRISLFKRYPTAFSDLPDSLGKGNYRQRLNLDRSHGFGGQDGAMLAEMSRYLNFTVIINRYNGTFGKVLSNGTITESLKEVVEREVAFSANGRFVMDYGTEDIEFTTAYSSDEMCIVVPKAQRIPQWAALFNTFDHASWTLILIVIVVTSTFWWFWGEITHKTNEGRVRYNWWEMLSILMGMPISLKPTSEIQIVFLATCLFFGVIILGTIQGTFLTAFATVSYYRDINTLEEMDDSGLMIASNFKPIRQENSSDIIKRLESKLIFVSKGYGILNVINGHKYGTVDRKRDVTLEIQLNFMRDDGFPLVHIVNECFTTYFLAYIVPKGSPLLHILNHVLQRLSQSGLTSKWYSDVVHSLTLEKVLTLKGDDRELATPFSMEDIQVAFILWTFGLVAACVAFLSEITTGKCAVCNPTRSVEVSTENSRTRSTLVQRENIKCLRQNERQGSF